MRNTIILLKILLYSLYVTLVLTIIEAVGIIVVPIVLAIVFKYPQILIMMLGILVIAIAFLITRILINITKGAIYEHEQVGELLKEKKKKENRAKLKSGKKEETLTDRIERIVDEEKDPTLQAILRKTDNVEQNSKKEETIESNKTVEESPVIEQPVIEEEKEEVVEEVIEDEDERIKCSSNDISVNEDELNLLGNNIAYEQITNLEIISNKVLLTVDDSKYLVICDNYNDAMNLYNSIYFKL